MKQLVCRSGVEFCKLTRLQTRRSKQDAMHLTRLHLLIMRKSDSSLRMIGHINHSSHIIVGHHQQQEQQRIIKTKHNIMSINNTDANATSKSTTFDDKIRQYASLFDGSKKDFSESAFNDLYHDDFLATDSIGIGINRETKKQLDRERLAAGVEVTNIEYTRIDWNKALVEFHVKNECHYVRVRVAQYLVTIKDKKIIEARHVHHLSGMVKASWLSNYHSIRRIQSYQHVDKVVFEGYTSPFADD
eukprot:scaffold29009_cov137-Skeletonema_menzelii.AAC.1